MSESNKTLETGRNIRREVLGAEWGRPGLSRRDRSLLDADLQKRFADFSR